MRRHISWLTAVVSTLALLAGVPTTASAAGPPAPVIVSPDGDTVQSTPVLTWNRATGAVKYEVTVSAAADFSGTAAFIQTTANVHATPLKDLPVGDWYWRVRGLDSTGMAGPYDTATFTRALDASPVLTSPVDAKTLKYPNEALSYQWEPFAGAKTYELQVDDDPAFIGAATAISTPNTSYSPTNSPAFDTPVYWRVRAKSANNVYSQWSEPFTYTITWDPATTVTLVGPPSSNSVPVEKVVLTWQPVRGAAFYQLDLSPDQNFNSPIYDDAKVVGNTFVPKTTLVAGAYYWRVRPMSSSITPEPGAWSDTGAGPWTFTKAWPASAPTSPRPQGTEDNRLAQVTLRSPANGDFTLARPTFSWSPQRNASHYEVQVGTDANFSPSTFNTCTTNHTTFTPYASCMPAYISPGVVRYWRVRAVDGVAASPAVYGAFSEVRSYLYDPAHIVQSSPAPGATVMTPVLRWSAVPNIARYKVTITGSAVGCAVSITAFVWNTTYVPETLRRDCTGPFSWTVQGVEDDGALTRLADAASWPTFTTEPEPFTASEPSPVVATPEAAFRPPLLDWPRVTGADGYQVYASVAGANSYTPLGAKTNQTMFAYTGVSTGGFGALLPPGDYDYYVRALNGATQLEPSPRGTFHIAPMPVTQLTAPADCPQGSCTAVEYDTPTFEWAPVAGAGYYLVYLATDPLFTNITKTYTTPFNSLRPMESLPDSQAGQATYWFVRPCYTAANCGPFDESVFGQARAFRKVSRPVEDLAAATPNPAPSATPVDNSVLFTWKDYLVTNTTGTPAVEQEAAYYQLQVSTTANFTSVIDTVSTLDQTAYLAPTLTYPDGPLYARIRAWDRTGNPLTWGDPISFTKSSPPPSGLTPMAGASVTGTPLLQWTPMASAQQYDVEIYRNPSSPISPTNLVTTIRTRLTTAALATALPAGQSYGWRVRRLDASSQASSWSALATFTVTGPAPVLTSPPNGTAVNSNALLFSWSAQARATRYKIDASTSSTFTSLIETATTDMTAWAPGLISPAWPNGTIYWRVSSLDTNNVVSGTSQTWAFTRDASTAGEFTAVTPYRAVDTRTSGGMIGAGQTRTVALAGGGTGIPTSGVTTVVVNVTVTGPTKGSYVTLFANGTTRPTVSTINFAAGQTVANHATVPVNATGLANYYNSTGSTHVIIDVVGYYSGGTLPRASRYTGADVPARLVDTRGVDGAGPTPLHAGESRLVEIAGLGGVPSNATAVVMNITAVSPTTSGHLRVYPAGAALPTASNVNFTAGRNVPNLVTMPIGAGGDIKVYNSQGTTHLLVDVVGWYLPGDPAPGARFNPVTPTRIVDTRSTHAPSMSAGGSRAFQVRGVGGVPNSTGVKAVVLNVTVTKPAGSGFVTVFASGTSRPSTSNLNYLKDQTVSNQVIATVGADGKVAVYTQAGADVILDVAGWMS